MKKTSELAKRTVTLDDGTTANFEIGSGNVFADLGLADAETLLAKVQLASEICAIITERDLTQQEAATLASLSQPKISAIQNRQMQGFSVERLLKVVNRLGHSVEIRVSRRSSAPERTGIRVVVA